MVTDLKEKFKVIVKKIKREIFGFNGNYYYGSTAQDYEAIRSQQGWWQEENKVVEGILNDFPKGLSVLDVPFGTGRFLPLYAAQAMKVTGLDISYAMLDTAKGLREELVKQCQLDIGDARKLPYADNSFDVVLSFRFLDGTIMFKDHKKVLAELVRVSRKYLVLEVFTPPEGNDPGLLLEKIKDNQPVNGRLSDAEREKLLTSFGMKVVKRVLGPIEVGLRSTVYLCEKTG
jgi:ubiquinone/menaquinone biosynthesis C-methylase UbiE